jgi:tetratricopeptide (TPR) repeat protein
VPYATVLRRLGRVSEAEEQLRQRGRGVPVIADRYLAEVRALRVGSRAGTIEAARLLAAGRVPEAVATLEGLLAQDADDSEIRHLLGAALLRAGRGQESVDHLVAAARLRPDAAKMQFDLGVALAAIGRPEEAANAYRAALAIDGDHHDARLQLGATLLAVGRPREAAIELDRVLAADPASSGAWLTRAAAEVRLGRTADALATLEQAIERIPDDWRLTAAWSRIAATALDPTLRDAERAVVRARANPVDHPLSIESLAMSLAASGDFEGAIRAQQRALALAEEGGSPPALLARLRRDLAGYGRGEPARDPALE